MALSTELEAQPANGEIKLEAWVDATLRVDRAIGGLTFQVDGPVVRKPQPTI
jgi:hypothetical protein